eukprot:scaffold807_cov67-Phaeocystis_antarctica.AAC.7
MSRRRSLSESISRSSRSSSFTVMLMPSPFTSCCTSESITSSAEPTDPGRRPATRQAKRGSERTAGQ